MVDSVERDFRRKFTGNASLYLDLEHHRARTVLQRNLRRVLEFQERQRIILLHKTVDSSNESTQPIPSVEGQGVDTEKRVSAGRKLPRKWLDEVWRTGSTPGRETTMKLDIKGGYKRKHSVSSRPITPEEEPPAKRLRGSTARCHCELSAWETSWGIRNLVVRKSQQCTLSQSSATSKQRKAFHVDMDKTFSIKARELFVDAEKNGVSKMAMVDSYILQITLKPLGAKDHWSQIFPKRAITSKPGSGAMADRNNIQQPFLMAEWEDFPSLPPEGCLLDLFSVDEGVKQDTEFELEVEAGWNAYISPLLRYKKGFFETAASRFPTPISEPDPAIANAKVTYIFGRKRKYGGEQRTRKITLSGWLCPLCRGRDFGSRDLLHFHLKTGHHLFRCRVETETGATLAATAEHLLVIVDIADKYPHKAAPSNEADDEFMEWVRPTRPFDMQKYLAGDESWSQGVVERLANETLGQLSHASQHSSALSAMSPSSRRDPDTVPDIPPPMRKKFTVPPGPSNVTFFRTTAKRPLAEGESISESDDEIDESWLSHKHQEIIDDFTDVTPTEKEFIKIYDAHILEEALCGNAHLGDSMIRFVRANRAWLARSDRKVEFSKNAAKLLLDGAIEEVVFHSCMKLIGYSNQDPNSLGGFSSWVPQSKPIRESRFNKDGESDDDISTATDTSRGLSPKHRKGGIPERSNVILQEEPQPTKIKETACLCGIEVSDLRTSILCDSPVSALCEHLKSIYQLLYFGY
ncbi:MAG: hypothetical protein M1827_003483 [Pycnora praestabilis]|nr:MAG: hypothetical protein M1827_003483 [Pycnora praestabilis]